MRQLSGHTNLVLVGDDDGAADELSNEDGQHNDEVLQGLNWQNVKGQSASSEGPKGQL